MVYLNEILNELVYQINEEWSIFFLVSALAGGLTYLGLRKFFLKRSAPTVATQLGIGSRTEHIENNSILVIISGCVGLLVGAGVARSDWVFYFGGSTLGIERGLEWVVAGLGFILPVLIVIGFVAMLFRPVANSIGKVMTAELAIILVWGVIKYFVIYGDAFYLLPNAVQSFFEVVAHPGVLILVMVFGGVVAKFSGR